MQNLARDEAGNVWELDAQGNAVRMVEPAAPATGRVFTLPQSPKDARQEALQERRENRADSNAARTAENEARRLALAEKAAARADQAASLAQSGTAKQRAEWRSNLSNIGQLQQTIQGLRSQYETHLKGKGLQSVAESFAPVAFAPQYGVFDDTAQSMLADMAKAKGLTAQQFNTPAEQRMFFEPLIPKRGDTDEQIEAKLANLERMIESGRATTEEHLNLVGQKADNEVPDPTTGANLKPPAPGVLDATTPNEGGGGPAAKTVASGGTRSVFDARVSAQIDAMVNAGASKGMIDAVLKKQNFPVVTPSEWTAIQTWRKQNPGKRYYGANISRSEDLNLLQRAAGSETGAFLTHMANNATAGIPAALAGPEGQGALDAMAANSPNASLVGGVLGGVTGAMGAEAAVAARAPAALAKYAPRIADTLYGGLMGFNQSREGEGGMGALLGAGAGLGGSLMGSAIGKGLGRIGGPKVAAADRSVFDTVKGDVTAIRPQLDEAQGLGLPLSLADTDPRLRALAGAVSRKSIDARELAERTFDPRALGQSERAIQAIDTHLAPTGDIVKIQEDAIARARLAANPLYEAAYEAPAIITPELHAVLNTPAGRQALSRARTIAANERRDPSSLGFALDADGSVVLRPVNMDALHRQAGARTAVRDAQNAYRRARASTGGDVDAAQQALLSAREELRAADAALNQAPSPETADIVPAFNTQTLDYVKRGLDDILEEQRNPITGKLQLDEAGRAINDVRSSLLSELDNLNPAYRDARGAYGAIADQGTSARLGYDIAGSSKVTPEQTAMALRRTKEGSLDHFRQGYASSLADRAERARATGNPYSAIYGSPAQKQKLETVFPDGSAAFGRVDELERAMSKTAHELLGGSPTAGRQAADEQLNGGLGTAALDFGSQLATGGGLSLGSMLNAGRRAVGDSLKLGIGNQAVKRADEIAPVLFDTNPAAVAAYLDDIVAKLAERAARSQNAGRVGGWSGAGVFSGLLASQ